jgi:histidinol phosphatase-like PHP family hydrolase
MERLFTKAANVGIGIELNKSDMSFNDNEADRVLRMFKIAKGCGCKFYLGTDGHHPKNFENSIEIFDRAISLLDLKESDKYEVYDL